ncbi:MULTISPECIES: hypothetical protein [unclassified Micromonospora]|uniref:hypothetical protein n=1 Tax=unclassified Micromonospora TaxID=2617518 RepID=UPI00363A5CCF
MNADQALQAGPEVAHAGGAVAQTARDQGREVVGAAVLGVLAGRLAKGLSAASDGTGGGPTAAYGPERTAVVRTPPAQRAVPDQIPRAATSTRPPTPATPAGTRAHPAGARPPGTPTRRTATAVTPSGTTPDRPRTR